MIPTWSWSQNEEDALRYSQTYLLGSVRNSGMGGAMTALGGDYSAGSQNPAGLGRFREHQFSFAPTIEYQQANSSYFGNNTKDHKTSLKLGQISYIKAYQLNPDNTNGWMYMQLGAGYNRLNTFNSNRSYSGQLDTSIIHYFIDEANGTSPNDIYDVFPFTSGLAYDTYAIDPASNNTYTTEFNKGEVIQSRTINTYGGIGEYNFSMSGNYRNIILVGGSININKIKYTTEYTHHEDFTAADSIWINSLNYLGNLSTEGLGINAKIGIIYTPINEFRIGLAYHSPTFYSMSDSWGNDMNVNTDDGIKSVLNEYKPYGYFDYQLITPMKANLSLAGIFMKSLAAGLELEYIDYRGSRLKTKKNAEYSYAFTSENAQIKNIYKPTLNIKAGGEYRLNQNYYLRLGYAFYGTPYTKASGVNTSNTHFLTTGFGLKFSSYQIDFSLVNRRNSFEYVAYSPSIKGSVSSFTESIYIFGVSLAYQFK